MSIEMEWSPDFCLACDRQSAGGAYCSQACRLADIERASVGSEPVSPSGANPSSWSSASSLLEQHTGFYLPPPLDFDAYRSARRASRLSAGSQSPSESPRDSYFPLMPAARPSLSSISGFKLSPSSSRTSLSSVGRPSSPDNGTLSDKARSELRGYASCFDQVRDSRRRVIAP